MLRGILFVAYVCVIHAQIVPEVVEDDTPKLRSFASQQEFIRIGHPGKIRYREDKGAFRPILNQPSANTRLKSKLSNQGVVQSIAFSKQSPSLSQSKELVQNTRWEHVKGSLLPHIIPSLAKYESEQKHILTNWHDAKNVILNNLNPVLAKSKEEPVQVDSRLDDENDLQLQNPPLSKFTEESAESENKDWDSTQNDMQPNLKPSVSQEQTPTTYSDYEDVKSLLLPNSSPALSKSEQPALTSWQDVQGHFYPGLSLPNDPKLWKPPSYFQSLKVVEDAMYNIKMHFAIDASTPKNDPRYKYIAVVHVIEGLTQEVSQHGWDTYNKNYNGLVLKLLDNISHHPEVTLAEVNCVFDASVKKIQRVKKLMTNQWVDYLCKAQPCVCDTLVYAIVKMSDDEELNQEAELLLLLGLAASDYLDIYSRVFEAVSKQNVYTFLKNSKETLRTLIYKNSIARRHSSFSLKDQCYAEHALPEDLS